MDIAARCGGSRWLATRRWGFKVAIRIAPTGPVEPERVAALIYSTDPHIFAALHDDDYELAMRHLAHQWQADVGVFSHSFAQGAWIGDMLAGIVLGYDAAELNTVIEPYLKQAQEVMNEAQFQGSFGWWSNYGYLNLPEIPGDAWYVQNLAVDEARRGQGIGAALLQDCAHRARKAGYRRVHLDVYDGNAAIELYRRTGYAVIAETRVLPLMANGFPAHLRMEKVL